MAVQSLRPVWSYYWGYSSVGRAPALQVGGQEFDSLYLHQDLKYILNLSGRQITIKCTLKIA